MVEVIGSVVAGRFRIDHLIAAGGMGVVYAATQQPLDRRVALKLIKRDTLDGVARARFEREARLASSLEHPNVVTVHDYGDTDDGGLYLAMELVVGETLRARLQRGALARPDIIAIARQVAAALGAAHARGLVHRDLKPENIMLVADAAAGPPRVKILDFGLAKDLADLLDGASLTRSGTFVGTPGYVAPDVMDGGAEDPRQDIYALGVVIWEALCGRHPFAAETPLKTIVRQMAEPVPAIDAAARRSHGLSDAFVAFVASLCARDPAARPADGNEALRELDALEVARAGAPTTSPGPPVFSAMPTQTDLSSPGMGFIVMHSREAVAIAEPAPPPAIVIVPRSESRWFAPLLVAGAVVVAVVVTALAVRVKPPPIDAQARGIAFVDAASTALARRDVLDARLALRSALELNDSPAARALWAAATDEPRILNLAIDGRLTDVGFAGEVVVVSNRARSLELFDLGAATRTHLRAHPQAVAAVAGTATHVASCDDSGLVRFAPLASDSQRSQKVANEHCQDLRVIGDDIWSVHRATIVRLRGDVVEARKFGGMASGSAGSLVVVDVDHALAVDEQGGLQAFDFSVPENRAARRSIPTPSPFRLLVRAERSGEMYAGGTAGLLYRLTVKDDAIVDATVVRRHSADITTIAVSPDGKWLVSGGPGDRLRFGAAAADDVVLLRDSPRDPLGAAFSASGRHLAVISRTTLAVYDVQALQRARAHGHTGTVEALDVRGDVVWSGGGDGQVFRWSADGEPTLVTATDAIVEELAIAPDGKRAALALSDGAVFVLDVDSGTRVGGWSHAGGARGLAWSSDGKLLASVGIDRRILVADSDQLMPRKFFEQPATLTGLTSVGFSDDGKQLAVGGRQSFGVVYDLATAREAWSITGRSCGTVWALTWRAGKVLSACSPGAIIEWGANGIAPLERVNGWVWDVDVHGPETIAAAGSDGVYLLNLARRERTRFAGAERAVNRVRFSDDGARLYTAADDGTVRAFAAATRTPLWALDTAAALGVHEESGAARTPGVIFADRRGDNICVAAARLPKTVERLAAATLVRFNAAGLVPLSSFDVEDTVTGVVATAGGCAVSTDHGVEILRGEDVLRRIEAPIAAIGNDDDEGLLIVSADEVQRLDDAGVERGRSALPPGLIARAVAARDGVLAVAGDDGAVHTLALRDPKAAWRRLLDGPLTAPTALATRAGLVAAGFSDGRVAAWDNAGRLIDATRVHGPVARLAFDDDGLLIASALGDGDRRLGAQFVDRCALLREVWGTVHGARVDGHVVAAPPPTDHPCAPR
ncbi:MAG: serine/threonine-protein kinase [Deltaproteobacteria bacterium]|nr:serine/threonine-protein kinase [Deltaproteobacteria bacterium]